MTSLCCVASSSRDLLLINDAGACNVCDLDCVLSAMRNRILLLAVTWCLWNVFAFSCFVVISLCPTGCHFEVTSSLVHLYVHVHVYVPVYT